MLCASIWKCCNHCCSGCEILNSVVLDCNLGSSCSYSQVTVVLCKIYPSSRFLKLSICSLMHAGHWRRGSLACEFRRCGHKAMPNSEEIPKVYWEAVLPGIPMPPPIINLLLAQQNDVLFCWLRF